MRYFSYKNGFVRSIFAFFLLYATFFPVMAQEEGAIDFDTPTFKLNVVEKRFLPPAMYGTWDIEATVLKSTAPPWLYMPSSSEVWTLQRDNGQVTLTNVVTNATASIEVDKVENDTATFHHVANVPDRNMKILEAPTLTVKGNHLDGVNRQQLSIIEDGKIRAVYHIDVQIKGTRLTGAQLKFRDPEDMPGTFEVAPLQFED